MFYFARIFIHFLLFILFLFTFNLFWFSVDFRYKYNSYDSCELCFHGAVIKVKITKRSVIWNLARLRHHFKQWGAAVLLCQKRMKSTIFWLRMFLFKAENESSDFTFWRLCESLEDFSFAALKIKLIGYPLLTSNSLLTASYRPHVGRGPPFNSFLLISSKSCIGHGFMCIWAVFLKLELRHVFLKDVKNLIHLRYSSLLLGNHDVVSCSLIWKSFTGKTYFF